MSPKYKHHAPDLLARVPAGLLRHLRAHGPQPKTFRAGDIVMPDPAAPRPRGKHKLADYVLVPEHPTVECGPYGQVNLRGHEVLSGGRLADKASTIDWPVLVIGRHQGHEQALQRLRGSRESALASTGRPPIQGERGWSWWHGMRADHSTGTPIGVGDIVQSVAGRHLRRLWKVVQIEPIVGGYETGSRQLLTGRRVSWKTGEVQPGRAWLITVEVVRLVPRETSNQQERIDE